MGQSTISGPEDGTPGLSHGLWTLLTTTSAVRDEHERVRLIATGIPSLVGCSLSGVALLEEKGASWKLVLQKNGRLLESREINDVSAGLEPLFKKAISGGNFLIVEPGEEPADIETAQFLHSFDLGCLAVVPLRTLRSQLGMLLVGAEKTAAFSAEDEFALRTLGEQLAISSENQRLHHEMKKHTEGLEVLVAERTEELGKSEERQRVLLEVNNAIIANLDRPSLFKAVAEALAAVIVYDRASFTEYDPVEDTLKISALTVTDASKTAVRKGLEFMCEGSHLGDVIGSKRPRIRSDLRKGPRTAEEDGLLNEGLRSYLSVPLIAKGAAIGTLNVASIQADCYDEEDAECLSEVAGQVALALENMFAYEEISLLKARLEQENEYLREEIKTQDKFDEIIGRSAPIKKAIEAINVVAPTDATVLVLGETGTGKELVAKAVHDNSTRKHKALVTVNCAALASGLIESEFFGHEKGAFTGALSRKIGRFEMADEGTIFLDEVGDLPLELQAKLLRVLQEGEFERLGSSETKRVDVRVIAATNRDLQEALKRQEFREDLYYRLNVFPIHVPALRDRREDISLLVKHFVMVYSANMGKKIDSIPERAIAELSIYNWPGNIRELRNVIERAVIVTRGSKLELVDWLPRSADTPTEKALGLEAVERQHIIEVLEMTAWRVSGNNGAAELLGLKPTTLEARMKKLGLSRMSSRNS